MRRIPKQGEGISWYIQVGYCNVLALIKHAFVLNGDNIMIKANSEGGKDLFRPTRTEL